MFRRFFSRLYKFFQEPQVSSGTVTVWVVLLFIGIVGMSFLLATIPGSMSRWFVIGFVIAFFGGLIVNLLLYRTALLNRIAPLVFNPYGIKDIKRSRQILKSYLFDSSKPTLYIRDGAVAEGSEVSLLKDVGKGPGELDIDWESAVLVNVDGKITRYLQGKHPLGENDNVIGYASLIPQKEPVDLEKVFTRDAVAIRVRGNVLYQIQQSKHYLQTKRAHHAELDPLMRALMPRDEWKTKTKGAIAQMVKAAVAQYEFSEFFFSPPTFVAGLAAGKAERPVLLDLQARAKNFLEEVVYQWGVEIAAVTFEEIVPSAELMEKANAAFQLWLERQAELEKVETQAQIVQKQAEAERDLAAIQREIKVIHAESDAQVKNVLADAEQYADTLSAQTKAEAHRLWMSAIGEAGSDVAKRIDLISSISGRSLDDEVLREFLRAIGLLKTAGAIEAEQTTHMIQIREMEGDGKSESNQE